VPTAQLLAAHSQPLAGLTVAPADHRPAPPLAPDTWQSSSAGAPIAGREPGYPDEVPAQPEVGGYQLGVAMDIFRGRYRNSLEHPTAIPANTVQRYRFALPTVDHVFLPGHRIMVQVQSSWFPLYDHNPQSFVDNIFFAKPADYRKATQRIYHQPGAATTIDLPVAP
jgi:hypothetical protein